MTQFSQQSALVVEDDHVLRDTVSFMLRRMGFQHVDTAGDVETAYALLTKRDFDIVVSDWNMDPLNGLDLLAMIRAHKSLMALPVIMMTANMSEDYWVEAIKAGATDFLQKPFALKALQETVALALDITHTQSAQQDKALPKVG
jgi:two-component system chemotaxis response regulator CheY